MNTDYIYNEHACHKSDIELTYPGLRSDLKFNGTYFPQAVDIVFNLKTEDEVPVMDENGNIQRVQVRDKEGNAVKDRYGNPVMRNKTQTVKLQSPMLTTVVTFDDGTKSEVRNSKLDAVTVVEKALPDGSKVLVADDASKERGIVYAVIKRLVSEAKTAGYVGTSSSFAKSMDWLMGISTDQNYVKAKAVAEKKAKKTERKVEKPKAKKAQKKYGNGDIIQLLGKFLERELDKGKFV